jgi:hypothetical protein
MKPLLARAILALALMNGSVKGDYAGLDYMPREEKNIISSNR